MRVIDKGYKIMFEKESKVVHWFSEQNREIKLDTLDLRKQLYFFRNSLIILLLHFNFQNIVFRLIRIIIGRIMWSIRNKFFVLQFKNLIKTILIIPEIIKKRNLLSANTQKLYNNGAFLGGFFFDGTYSFKRPKWLKQN
jgi:GT2 family glycosyltransferase